MSVVPLPNKSGRKLNSWVRGFLEYSKAIGSPPIWRLWSALSAVSGALERRCSLETRKGSLAPNLFVLLVGPPGTGKSIVIDEIFDFCARTRHLHVAPSTITRAGLIDYLADAKRVIQTIQDGPLIYHSVICASAEFGNLVPAYDNEFLNTLNELYDCRKVFEAQTRLHGRKTIDYPHLVILAGTQPMYLASLLPDTAFGMGFTSRFIMVYSGTTEHVSMFGSSSRNSALRSHLDDDFQQILQLQGEFRLTEEAEVKFEKLHEEGFLPKPDHPKLAHYSTRRPAHILKLSMCFSAAESSSMLITPSHLDQAFTTLVDCEKVMPQIFREMSAKGYADVSHECWAFAQKTWMGTGRKPLLAGTLVKFLIERVPQVHVLPTLENMIKAGMLRKVLVQVGNQQYEAYEPRTDQAQ